MQAYHKDILEHRETVASADPAPGLTKETSEKSPAKIVPRKAIKNSIRKLPVKRGRESRSGIKHGFTGSTIGGDTNSF